MKPNGRKLELRDDTTIRERVLNIFRKMKCARAILKAESWM